MYTRIAKEAYDIWSTSPTFRQVFSPSPFALVAGKTYGKKYIDQYTSCLDDLGLPWEQLPHAAATKSKFPILYQDLPQNDLSGYCNMSAGWADAHKAIAALRDYCIECGVSFISGSQGSVTGFNTSKDGKITAVKTADGHHVFGDHFILSAGAWSATLVSMHNSTIATGQVLGYIALSAAELLALKDLPICINFDSG